MTQALHHTHALPPAPARMAGSRTDDAVHCAIGLQAVRALRDELLCYPKPGLVSAQDNGSHTDMHAGLFLTSLLALQDYFPAIAAAGARDAGFTSLQTLGRNAEVTMLRATGGINTHRGAIFCLGLLAAAAGRHRARAETFVGCDLGRTVRERWGESLLAEEQQRVPTARSHGALVARRYGLGGARAEAAAGFPAVFDVGLPALRLVERQTGDTQRATLHCFFSLMAVVADTNLLYRGGRAGLDFAQQCAHAFLTGGGVHHPAWRQRAEVIHHQFIERRLSPGGSADLLAATLFVHGLQQAGAI